MVPARCFFSGIQPSGPLHLGNYLGAIKPWLQLRQASQPQDRFLIEIADLHAAGCSAESTLDTACQLVAAGINPDDFYLFRQSRVMQFSFCLCF